MLDEERADGSPITGQRPGHLGAAQDHQARRRLGDGHRSRTSTARIDVLLFPSAYQLASTCSSRTRSSPSRAGSRARKDQPELHGQEVSVPDLTDGPVRSGRDQPALDPLHAAGRRAAARTCSAPTRG